MNVEQHFWNQSEWSSLPEPGGKADLVFLFGGRAALNDREALARLRAAYPGARLLGCSTAGEIHGTSVSDDCLVATAVAFEHTTVRGICRTIDHAEQSFEAGDQLARSFEVDGLTHVFVLSNGLKVNGSELVKGMTAALPEGVVVTGGLAGDGANFEETSVLWDDQSGSDTVAAIGLYGDRLIVGYGSLGGWDSFGPQRRITRSEGNVLYELDGKPALELYKRYLGAHAEGLPATGLLFPLSLSVATEEPVVRTILAVDEDEGSMTFAGDVPERSMARLMKANFDRLIDGAARAARTSHEALGKSSPDLAILISCVGRKLVLKQRVEEEVEAVRDCLGSNTVLTGFYSYGEISPFTPDAKCELHNQTMTVTTFSER